MTGFAYAELQDESIAVVLELKAYNNRFLDIQVSLQPFLSPLEPRIREYLASRIGRGRVEVILKITAAQRDVEVALDENLARAYKEALQRLVEAAGLDDQIRLSHLIRLEGILEVDQKTDLEEVWQKLFPVLEKSFSDFEKTRTAEGSQIQEDIIGLLDAMDQEVRNIDDQTEELEEHIKTAIRERFQQLLGDGADENRVFSETALLLLKLDIHEEVVRMRSHLESFRETLRTQEPMGKKLDFICQELNREVNTLASKSLQLPVHKSAIRIKDALEKIREQLRNVE
jgi:uncharacterized protein (TIGR00255 family)